MPKKIALKTKKSVVSVAEYIAQIEPESVRATAVSLNAIFEQATGTTAKMWGSSIIGFGEYTYSRANGDEGNFMACGFAIRGTGPVLYIIPGYSAYGALLAELGPHKLGKSCLYLKDLQGINTDVIRQLVALGIDDLKKKYAVTI